MRVGYLTGERIYFRPLEESDQETATAWFDSPFPINGTRAKAYFDEDQEDWYSARFFVLALARTDDDEVVGSVTYSSHDRRVATVGFHMAPAQNEADELRAEAIRIVIPWLRDEHEFMIVRLSIASDQPESLRAAEELGMQTSVRLREWIARDGTRVDEIVYEALNRRWEVQDA
ncbi:MAG: GNAT family protein [Nitrolancea sp.]